jgi:predicted transcriptional regulator
MVITLEPDLESALNDLAQKRGVSPEVLAVDALRERFLAPARPFEPQDEWERRLLEVATDCGVSLSHEAVSSEGLYE